MKILIKNGFVVDPANRVQAKLDVMIEDGRIAALGRNLSGADQIIDASGKIVCPGFIDIHMHEDPVGKDGRICCCIFDTMLRMGVTTVAGGNCGTNECDPLEYLDIVDRYGAPVNVAMFAGHGYFRKKAGAADKYAGITPEQQKSMVSMLQTALDGGCMGVSFGLRYVPGVNEDEFRAAAACCSAQKRMITAHVRDDAEYIFESIDEVARMGAELGIPVQISHIGSMGGFGQMREVLRQVDEYRANGLDIAMDCYPYFAFSTTIGATTYDDGWLERYHCDYSACMLTEGKYKGQRCTKEIFEELRRDHPGCITVCYVMQEADVRMALAHPNVMLGSDGLLNEGQGHPRAAGAFPRFYREFVYGGDIELYEGIRKMTSLPAERLGLKNKGRLNAGADADIVIFDPLSMRDRATFEEPSLPPEGISYVLIGGKIAARNCKIVDPACGRAVRWEK